MMEQVERLAGFCRESGGYVLPPAFYRLSWENESVKAVDLFDNIFVETCFFRQPLEKPTVIFKQKVHPFPPGFWARLDPSGF